MQFLQDYNIPPLTAARSSSGDSSGSEDRASLERIGRNIATSIASESRFGASFADGFRAGVGKNKKDSYTIQSELLTLIEERRWPELRKFVRRRDVVKKLRAKRRKGSDASDGSTAMTSMMGASSPACCYDPTLEIDGNALHLLCSYQPPRDVVRLFLQTFPHYASEADVHGHTPLHVAVDYFAGPEVVSSLLEHHPSASDVKDALGKTPLMHACENATGEPRSNGVIKALVSVNPYSVLEEDNNERTALEHAINADAPTKVIRALQGTSIRVARDVRKHGGLERARDALRERMERSAEAAAACASGGQPVPPPPSPLPFLGHASSPEVTKTLMTATATTTTCEQDKGQWVRGVQSALTRRCAAVNWRPPATSA